MVRSCNYIFKLIYRFVYVCIKMLAQTFSFVSNFLPKNKKKILTTYFIIYNQQFYLYFLFMATISQYRNSPWVFTLRTKQGGLKCKEISN